MRKFERKDERMPEAIRTFSEKVLQIVQEMDASHDTHCVMICPISELPPQHEKHLPRELQRRLVLVHGNAWLKCSESRVHDGAITLLIECIRNSEYFKREGLRVGLRSFKVIRSHTCGLLSGKIADFAFEKCSLASPHIGHVYGEVAFHHETPTLLMEEMVNALSPFHTFEISVGMKIQSINRNRLQVEIRTFVRMPQNIPAHDDVDQSAAMQKRSDEIQRARGKDYNPKEAAEKFHPSRVGEFPREFGVLQIDHQQVTIIRGLDTRPMTVRMTLAGDTFTLTSLDFSDMLDDYTIWWDQTHPHD